jgi:hypothetical protein
MRSQFLPIDEAQEDEVKAMIIIFIYHFDLNPLINIE